MNHCTENIALSAVRVVAISYANKKEDEEERGRTKKNFVDAKGINI